MCFTDISSCQNSVSFPVLSVTQYLIITYNHTKRFSVLASPSGPGVGASIVSCVSQLDYTFDSASHNHFLIYLIYLVHFLLYYYWQDLYKGQLLVYEHFAHDFTCGMQHLFENWSIISLFTFISITFSILLWSWLHLFRYLKLNITC